MEYLMFLVLFIRFVLANIVFTNIVLAQDNKNNIDSYDLSSYCKVALDFYLDRPDLETEFLRRFEFCKNTAKNVSPDGYNVNPIISNFKSMYGVNGRTRVNIHQGIDIIGAANENIIAIADGKVLETGLTYCEGPSLVIDHGTAMDGKKLIAIYSHIGQFMVKEGDRVKRGSVVAKLPLKIEYPCMARVRHLHLQIGQEYCEKEEKNTWGCKFYIKDLYSSLNPNDYWADGVNKVTCFDEQESYSEGFITYPFACIKNKSD